MDDDDVVVVPKVHKFSLYMSLRTLERLDLLAVRRSVETGKVVYRSQLINEAVGDYLRKHYGQSRTTT